MLSTGKRFYNLTTTSFGSRKPRLRADFGSLSPLCSRLACPPRLRTLPSGKPQIQGGNLRIEFDNHLRSRVVARFDNKETVMGPFTASETVTTADKAWDGFLLASQKREHAKDAFGEGERLTVEGKTGTLTKIVTVTVYDDFPAMAFFEVQYTNTGTTKLAIKSWTNNAYTVNAQIMWARQLSGLTRPALTRNAPTGSYRCALIFGRRIIKV